MDSDMHISPKVCTSIPHLDQNPYCSTLICSSRTKIVQVYLILMKVCTVVPDSYRYSFSFQRLYCCTLIRPFCQHFHPVAHHLLKILTSWLWPTFLTLVLVYPSWHVFSSRWMGMGSARRPNRRFGLFRQYPPVKDGEKPKPLSRLMLNALPMKVRECCGYFMDFNMQRLNLPHNWYTLCCRQEGACALQVFAMLFKLK